MRRRKNLKERIRKSTKLQELSKFSSEFCEHSTIHGVRYFSEEKRHWTERLWWIIAFGLSFWLCSWAIRNTLIKWYENPITFNYGQEISISEIPFPTITICPGTKTLRNKMNLIAINQMNEHNFTDIEKNRLEALYHICPALPDYNMKSEFADEWIYDVMTDIAPTFRDTVEFCVWRLKTINCSDYFVPMLTEIGHCFAFNALNSHEIYTDEMAPGMLKVFDRQSITRWSLNNGYIGGTDDEEYPIRIFNSGHRGLTVYLNMSKKDLEYLCHETGFGFTVIFSAPGDSLKLSRYSFRAPLAEDTRIAIKPKFTTTTNGLINYKPEDRYCFFDSERQLRFFRNYTQTNCDTECLANFTKIQCGCVKFAMPRDKKTKICGSNSIQCYLNAENKLFEEDAVDGDNDTKAAEIFRKDCNCMPACTSIEYDADINYIKFDMEIMRKSDSMISHCQRPSMLTIYFRDRDVEHMERAEVYTFIDFMAICGGLMGLFLGVSLLSIIEFIYFFTLRLFWSVRRGKSENVVSPFQRKTVNTVSLMSDNRYCQ